MTDAPACRQIALKLLMRRDHSRLELQRKLASRDCDEDVIAGVLDALEEDGLLSESRFAESFIRSRAIRGQGPVRIRRDLAERGLSSDDYDSALASEDFDWFEIARRVRVKRFGAERPADYKDRARQGRFLQQRGFNMDQIRFALDAGPESD